MFQYVLKSSPLPVKMSHDQTACYFTRLFYDSSPAITQQLFPLRATYSNVIYRRKCKTCQKSFSVAKYWKHWQK